LYCNEQKIHRHASITVARETDKWAREFNATENKITSLFNNAKEKLSTYERLIAMCERLTVDSTANSLSSDWEVFNAIYLQFQDKLKKEIQPNIAECRLL
jgi:hypothetical protein